ncbi:hypothetical protein Hanom_Chr04g00374151 [Helianthus anomalus]
MTPALINQNKLLVLETPLEETAIESNPIVNQLKPNDSGSKDVGRNHNRIVNQVKPVHDSGSLAQVADDLEHVNNQSKSELKKNKKKKKNPRFVTDQKQTGGSTEPELEKEKKQHGYKGNRVVTDQKQTGPEPVHERKQHGGRHNQEVREPKGKRIPFAQNVDDSVAAAKDRTRLGGSGRFNGGRNNARRDSGRFQGMRGSKHLVPLQIWVRKGESEVSPSF